MCYYNRLLVECTELVIGKSTEAKARNNKLKLSEKCHPCSMFQITNVITASQNLSLQQSGDPVSSAWATRCIRNW